MTKNQDNPECFNLIRSNEVFHTVESQPQSLPQPGFAEEPLSGLPDRPIAPLPEVDRFPISPLVRVTLLALYIALTVPLPFLAQTTQAPIPTQLLWVGIAIGFAALYAALTERVVVDAEQIQVTYPAWVPRFFRSGWTLPWSDIQALKPRSTGQGGIVYYLLSRSGQGYLLPMRVAGFGRLVRWVQAQTGIETRDVRPLSQPWMYLILLGCTVLLLFVDAWTVWTAIGQTVG